ncbi:MAG TPA: hypothetical protein VHL09_13585 [Dehalococcoidia bacterium]|nr:hypothetical protein [Dehalococcoidia bacterium]
MNSRSSRAQQAAPAAEGTEAQTQVQPAAEPAQTPAVAEAAPAPRRRRPSAAGARSDLRQDLEATLQSRQELGPAYDSHLIEAFLERLDRSLDERIEARLHSLHAPQAAPASQFTKEMVFALAVTMIFGTGLTAIGAEHADVGGILAIWIPIAVIWLGILGYLPRPKR